MVKGDPEQPETEESETFDDRVQSLFAVLFVHCYLFVLGYVGWGIGHPVFRWLLAAPPLLAGAFLLGWDLADNYREFTSEDAENEHNHPGDSLC